MARLGKIFSFLLLTAGRRIHALLQMRRVADLRRYTDLVSRIDLVIAHERRTRSKNTRWAALRAGPNRGRSRYKSVLGTLDPLLDAAVTGLRDMAEAQGKGARADDPIHALIQRFLDAVFPAGVAAVTRLPYTEEIAEVENILDLCQNELAELVAELRLERQVARIAELAREYREAVSELAGSLSFDDVHAQRSRGHAMMLELVAVICGMFPLDEDPEHQRARGELLGPIFAQEEATRAYQRARRPVRDIDPDTGEEDAEDAEDTADSETPADGAEVPAGTGPAEPTDPGEDPAGAS